VNNVVEKKRLSKERYSSLAGKTIFTVSFEEFEQIQDILTQKVK